MGSLSWIPRISFLYVSGLESAMSEFAWDLKGHSEGAVVPLLEARCKHQQVPRCLVDSISCRPLPPSLHPPPGCSQFFPQLLALLTHTAAPAHHLERPLGLGPGGCCARRLGLTSWHLSLTAHLPHDCMVMNCDAWQLTSPGKSALSTQSPARTPP